MSEVFQSRTQQAETYLANAREYTARREALLRLDRNPDFKRMIMELFCGEEAARFAHQSADPALTAEQRADALNMAQASGHLLRWIRMTLLMGQTAEREIPDIQNELEELRQEEGAA